MATTNDDSNPPSIDKSSNDPVEQHPSKQLVEQGYDQIAPRYLEWATSNSSPRLKYLHKLLGHLPTRTKVLELGCGAGIPCTQILARSHEVVGNDISSAQIELAKKHVPNAQFVKGDMMGLEFEQGSVGAVVAFYSVIHLPREEQMLMLKRIAGWLCNGGYLLVNLGAVDNPGSVNEDWLGGKMYWSSFDATANAKMVTEAGFELVEEEVTKEEEDGVVVPFLWILARKAKTAGS